MYVLLQYVLDPATHAQVSWTEFTFNPEATRSEHQIPIFFFSFSFLTYRSVGEDISFLSDRDHKLELTKYIFLT